MHRVRIDRFDPGKRRLVVFSDVHADLSSLRRALDAAQLRPDDILVPVGDYIERGPDSLGTLRFMMELCGRYETHALIGNVDSYVLRMFTQENPGADGSLVRALSFRSPRECRWAREARTAFGLDSVPELNPPPIEDEEAGAAWLTPARKAALYAFRDRFRETYARELSWMEALPAIADTPQRIFVHGGLPHEDIQALVGTDDWWLTKNDNFIGQGLKFSRTVVVGHYPAILYRPGIADSRPFYSPSQNILAIDGGSGVKLDGQVNVLVFPDPDSAWYELYFADALPPYEALDAQTASESPVSVHWGDHWVDILQREGDCLFVRHRSTGRTLWVPAAFLYRDGAPAQIEDSTSYELPVKPGDRLGLVCRTSRGAVVKKGSITGWYKGRLAGPGNAAGGNPRTGISE